MTISDAQLVLSASELIHASSLAMVKIATENAELKMELEAISAKARMSLTEEQWADRYENYEGDGSHGKGSFVLVAWDDPSETPSQAIIRLNKEAVENAHIASKLQGKLDQIDLELESIAEATGIFRVSVREGGGPEDLLKTIAVSVIKLKVEYDRLKKQH